MDCASPQSYQGFAPGTHSFSVVAVSPGGAVSDAAVQTWTISAASHLQYFGYLDNLAPGQADHVNLGFGSAATEIPGKAFIVSYPFAWSALGADPITSADVQGWLSSYGAKQKYIAAVYVQDEPDCGAPFPTGWTLENCLATTAHLEATISKIKAVMPGVKTWVNYTSAYANYFRLSNAMGRRLPSNADWISFDCYSSFDSCFGGGNSVANLVEGMEQYMSPSQSIVLVPQGFQGAGVFGADNPASQFTEAELAATADQYYQFAVSDPRVVAITPWLWRDFSGSRGASSLPTLQAKFRQIGQAIIAH